MGYDSESVGTRIDFDSGIIIPPIPILAHTGFTKVIFFLQSTGFPWSVAGEPTSKCPYIGHHVSAYLLNPTVLI
jgi:hypothetical protein